MADPLDVLFSPSAPVAPDPAFAARLRARLVRALSPVPEGDPMPTATAPAERAVAEPVITPYLAVADARAALDWYVDALGLTRRGEPIVMEDGRIGHAELAVAGGGVIMLSDEYPDLGVVAPSSDPAAGVTFSIHANVADVDALTRRAVDAGAILEREPADHPYGRNAVIRDPFGHRWMLSSPVPSTVHEPAPPYVAHHGDLAYVSLWVHDMERAASFYRAVLGWRFDESGRHTASHSQSLPHGLWTGEQPSLFMCIAVDDLDAAVERVRAAGGTAGEPQDEPHGRVVDCVDDQGMSFALYQTPGGGGVRGPVNGERNGDLGYVTVETVDSQRFRDFFGRVVGWRFSPGHVDDGWQAEDTVPMLGLHGGHDHTTVVPMYRVDDIDAAVAAVRANGGTATDVEQAPYGLTSTCADDQGTRFYLGQL
jgi:uncharacterized glyoxalase superfamily protein PhnB